MQRPVPSHGLKKKVRVGALKQRGGRGWVERRGAGINVQIGVFDREKAVKDVSVERPRSPGNQESKNCRRSFEK